MKIEHNNSDSRGIFTAKDDNKQAGEMTYSRRGSNIVIEHTEVDPQYQGQGVGKQLVEGAVDFARDKDLKIVPECSYARKVLERSSDYNDVLA